MKLTLGMATYQDFDGPYFTITSLRTQLLDLLDDIEILVVDNDPDHANGKRLEKWMRRLDNATYIPYTQRRGTSAPRDLVFVAAKGEFVCCMDSHIILFPQAIRYLLKYFKENPQSNDLIQGPIAMDHLRVLDTHWYDRWDEGMRGKWCRAMYNKETDTHIETFYDMENKEMIIQELMTGRQLHEELKGDRARLYSNLSNIGYSAIGFDDENDKPFEIPAMGLGLFAARKEAWPMFCKDETFALNGFGGEECNIHELFRQQGNKTICLPQLKWVHRFNSNVRVDSYGMCRNYVLWANRLNRSYDDIYHEHCVKFYKGRHLLSEAEWQYLIANPVEHVTRPKLGSCPGNHNKTIGTEASMSDILNWAKSIPRDLDQHLDDLKAIGQNSESITEISKRKESAVAFAAALGGNTKKLNSYNSEGVNEIFKLLDQKVSDGAEASWNIIPDPYKVKDDYDSWFESQEFEDSDTFFLDTRHSEFRLGKELDKIKNHAKKWIVIRGTNTYGFKDEVGNGLGLYTAIETFLDSNPEWRVVFHADKQSGMTVLSRNGEKPLGFGPGTSLKKILSKLGIKFKETCGCNTLRQNMDLMGPEKCLENIDNLVSKIEKNKEAWGWNFTSAAKAAGKAVFTGLALKINPLKPVESCVRLAIEKSKDTVKVDGERFFLYK